MNCKKSPTLLRGCGQYRRLCMCGNREYMENLSTASQVYYESKAALKRKKKTIGNALVVQWLGLTLSQLRADQQTKILQVSWPKTKRRKERTEYSKQNRRGVRERWKNTGKMLIVLTVRLNNEHVECISFTVLTAYMHILRFFTTPTTKISKNSVIKWWFIPYRIFILSSMKIPVYHSFLKKIHQEHQLVLPFSISVEKTKYSKSKFLRENSVTTLKQ